jgi:hypothetical protein
MSFAERIGAALVAPRRALAAADAPDGAGRAGTDAALLLLYTVLALHTRDVVVGAWLVGSEGVSVGLGALASLVGRSVGTDLVFLLAAGALVTVAAGRRRSLGRDFDLACVAYVPFVAVQVTAALVLGAAGAALPRGVTDAVVAAAFTWAGAIVALAIVHARTRADGEAA